MQLGASCSFQAYVGVIYIDWIDFSRVGLCNFIFQDNGYWQTSVAQDRQQGQVAVLSNPRTMGQSQYPDYMTSRKR